MPIGDYGGCSVYDTCLRMAKPKWCLYIYLLVSTVYAWIASMVFIYLYMPRVIMVTSSTVATVRVSAYVSTMCPLS